MKIDLDAAAAARREAAGEAPVVIFGGKEYALPVEFPLEAGWRLADVSKLQEAGDVVGAREALKAALSLLLDDTYDQFMAAKPSYEDLNAFLEGVGNSYGQTPGGSSASPDS